MKSTVDHGGDHKHTNRLIDESSPYLLQHAHNPVDWYPWGDEALKKAQDENKLIIISVGYAACHWCHVMEHESFEDSIVAAQMNEHFVSIKVDREERPDVDDVYMTAAQLLTGSGGWPLNAIALPDGRPVFAGTYYPKKDWMNILAQIIKVKNEKPEKLEESAEKITQGIKSSDEIVVNNAQLDFVSEELEDLNKKMLSKVDFIEGGRQGAPKFPMPNNYEFLLKYHWLTGDEKTLDAVNTTLTKMAYGGIYDHLGGGFARYSTDASWVVPHFEKMLYDNGQLVSLYSQAYQLTKNPLYKNVVEETLAYTAREMTSPEYGFYSSLDADSEGEEGKFYVWQKSEIDSLIGDETQANIFHDYYSVKNKGNWEHTNILYRKTDADKIAKKHKLTIEQLNQIITTAKSTLFEHRSTRIRPGLDDKILSSWNALMLKGYVDAFNAFGNKEYLDIALKNGNFILEKMINNEGRLNRNYKNGKSSINAFLDDYALCIHSFIALYQASFDEKWLAAAQGLMDHSLEHFYNEETKMFRYTSDLDPPLISQKTELADNVIPGSNSMMARNLFALGTLKYNTDYVEKSKQMLKNIHPQIMKSGTMSFFSNWLQLYFDFVKTPYEIAIVGNDAISKRNEFAKNYLANSFFLGGTTEGSLDLLKDKLQEDRTMIYVCQNKTCKLPVSEVNKALELIDK